MPWGASRRLLEPPGVSPGPQDLVGASPGAYQAMFEYLVLRCTVQCYVALDYCPGSGKMRNSNTNAIAKVELMFELENANAKNSV